MCGITGFVGPRRAWGTIDRTTPRLVHRGPDDQSAYIDSGMVLGVRRLGVIDLATDHQPLANEDGTVWVVHNGEIHNFCAPARYWELPFAPDPGADRPGLGGGVAPPAAGVGGVQRVSDVPLGLFLSGGMGSSAIVDWKSSKAGPS